MASGVFLRTKIALTLGNVLITTLIAESRGDLQRRREAERAAKASREASAEAARKQKEAQDIEAAAQKRAKEASARTRIQPRGNTKW